MYLDIAATFVMLFMSSAVRATLSYPDDKDDQLLVTSLLVAWNVIVISALWT